MNGVKSPRLKGDIWATVSALATGGGFTVAKTLLLTLPPIVFNAYMFLFGSVIILIDAGFNRKLKETLFIPPAQIGFFAIVAIFFSAATYCLFTALSFSEPATVSFLSRLELVSTIILAAIFLKERLQKSEVFGLIIVVAGIFVMRYNASIELSRTVTLVTLGSLFFGTAEVLTKWKIDWINHRSYIFYRGIFMSGIFIIAGIITSKLVFITDIRLLGLLALTAFLLPYMGRTGYLKAMKYINISRSSIIVQSQPFFAAIVALAILNSFPSIKEIFGGLLIVGGVILMKVLEKKATTATR
ncbi:MAG: DMT family transporter [candidate division Zixibacteria bacterium]